MSRFQRFWRWAQFPPLIALWCKVVGHAWEDDAYANNREYIDMRCARCGLDAQRIYM